MTMGLLGFLDAPRSRRKKHRRRSAWVEETQWHRLKSTAIKRCRKLRKEGYRTKIVTLPNGDHVIFKKK